MRLRPGSRDFGAAARRTAISIEVFMGLGAIYGALELLHDAEEFGVRAAWLHGSPFPDYTVPALLLLALGCGLLMAAVLVASRHHRSTLATTMMGALLLVFIAVETAVIGYHGGSQSLLLGICGGSGLTLVVLGRLAGPVEVA
jgi:hypothetical protein